MVRLGAFCGWCLAVHAASLLTWLLVEASARLAGSFAAQLRRGAALAFFAAAVVVSLLAVEAMRGRQAAAAAAEAERRMVVAAPDAGRIVSGTRSSAAASRRSGSPDAAVEIVVFSDYRCPDCRSIEAQITELAARPDVTVVHRHFPLDSSCNASVPTPIHPDACRRARLAEAAGQLGGSKGRAAAHAALFAMQDDATGDAAAVVAAATGLSPAALISAADSTEAASAVATDIAEAIALGVTYVPMVFVNGVEWTWYAPGMDVRLGDLVDRVAKARTPRKAPPDAIAKFVADWRLATPLRPSASGAPRGALLRDGDRSDVPEIMVWLDYRVPGSRVLDQALRDLAADGPPFRWRVFQFPANAACNAMRGLPEGDPRACLASALAVAAGIAGGDEGFRRMHRWLLDQTEEITADAAAQIVPSEERSRFLEALGSGTALEMVRAEADALNGALRVQAVPTVVIDGRPVPRWEHPGAAPVEVLRRLLEAAHAERQTGPARPVTPDR
jgi:protein-disulfide isomerase